MLPFSHVCRYHSKLITRQLRWFLSPAYGCQNEWDARRENLRILNGNKDVDPFECIAKVHKYFLTSSKVSPLDVDIVANSVNDTEHLPDLKHFIYKLRHGNTTSETLDSTHCAIARVCMELDNTELLMEFLSDTINFGVFPDNFSANLLMDDFLKKGQFFNAAKVAWYLMQQEMFDNQLSCFLSTYSCAKWLETRDTAVEGTEEESKRDENEEEDDDEDEEFIFKVPFLKNAHFDNHFDLTNDISITGKTLWWMGENLSDSAAARSAQLLGLILHEQPELALKMINENCEKTFISGAIDQCNQLILSKSSKAELAIEWETVKDVLSRIEVVESSLSDALLTEAESIKSTLEEKDIELQKELFKSWDDARKRKYDAERNFVDRELRLKEIEDEKKSLTEDLDRLNFFENREFWEKQIDMESLKEKQKAKSVMEMTDDEYLEKLVQQFDENRRRKPQPTRKL